ncbi:MAG: VWA domain-containing protein [Chloroflexi bacterium]|nr:VWA domain-containing protein [Chloroflexota bacterium]
MTDPMRLSATWGRAPVPRTDTPQVAYALLDIAIPAPVRAVPLNVCLVLDRSGSMQGTKLAALKQATAGLLAMLTADDVVSIVLFDETAEVLVPATPARDPAALTQRVAAIVEQGGTAMSTGMAAGLAELERTPDAGRAGRMVLLTDGRTWGDEDRCRELATALSTRRVAVTALGLGAEWNEALLDAIADTTGGSSDYIADPAQIGAFFRRAVETAQATVATDARLTLRFARDVTPRAVWRTAPAIRSWPPALDEQRGLVLPLGTLDAQPPTGIVLEVLIAPRPAGTYRIAQAELQAMAVGGATLRATCGLVLEIGSDVSSHFDARVMNLVERVTAFRLQTRALAEAEAGDAARAAQTLRAAATRLLDLGEVELAQATQREADAVAAGTAGSPEQRKAMHYATRKLTTRRLDDGQGSDTTEGANG